MANYELSNIAWKGNTYTVKDNSALHQSAIGSWTPDFANLKPLATYEYDISSTSYFKICERPNVASIKDIADEVLAFRITVTGTNIFSVADVLVRAQPTVNVRPLVTVNYQTQSTSAGTTGIRYLRTVNPKAANTSYTYEIAIAAYNSTKRHIKVEVFKTTSDWTFSSAATVYSYNSTYQTASDLTLYTSIGIFYNYTFYATANYANYAGYNSVWMGLFNSNQAVLVAGAAIAASQFAFVGEDYKVYPVTNTSQPILTSWPIIFVTSAIDSGANCTWSYLRTWGHGTPATSILRDTLAAHDTVYLKCAYTNGKVYSQNRITPTISVGSNSTDTYYRLGVMYSATALAFNTLGGVYFTVDMDGNMRAINGYSLNAAKADTANAVKRQYNLVGANDYPILFDSNPSSDIATATTIPSLTPALKYNPSTGNLTSGIFTGSGAGLTDIPLSSIQGADELLGEKEDLSNKVTSVDSSSTDDQYPSAKLLYDTKNTLSGMIQDVDEAIPSKMDMSKQVFTGTCTTAAGTAAKTVNVGDGFELVDGVKIRVYMNTANSNTAPTLNVNSTGAKAIVIAGPAAMSNEALSNTTSGFFKRNGWFEFTYAASYGSGAGRWVMDDTYSAGRLLNTFMTRPSTINSDIANGGVRYGVIASSATGNPFSATASVLWLHHDSANYTRQIAIAATIPPQMAFRAQNNGTWQPWEYVLSSANQLENHMATLAYTASAIDFTTGAVTIPIDGTKYKLLQLTLFNNDISKVLGYPSLFLFNAGGTIGYKEGTSYYCSATSTSSNISITFDSSWGIIGSTSVDITALYRRIS